MKAVRSVVVATMLMTVLLYGSSRAQEFGVAVGSDTTWSAGAVYGGSTGLVAVQGNAMSQYTINAQIINTPNQLVGQRIYLDDVGLPPGAMPFFDGTNYF